MFKCGFPANTTILYHIILNFSPVFLQKQKKFIKSPKVFKDPENNMKKEEFLKSLQARLVERGLTEAAAEKETEHVRTYLAESSMDEVDISIDEMADGILAMLEDGNEDNYIRIRDEVNKSKNKKFTGWFYGLGNIFLYEHFKNENIITDRHILSNYCWSGDESTDYIFDSIFTNFCSVFRKNS